MAFSIRYKPLFEVNIYHLFFLDKGNDEYLSMTGQEKDKQDTDYNISDTINIVPTSESLQKIAGRGLIFRANEFGFSVWSKVSSADDAEPFIALDDTLELTFLLKLRDGMFFNYTRLDLENTDKLFYFSNKIPDTEPGTFPLINRSGELVAVNDNSVLSDDGASDALQKISASEKNNLFGLVSIWMKGDVAALDVTDVTGHIPDPYQSFELLFKPRKTTWRYIFDTDQTVVGADDVEVENGNPKTLTSKTEQPLTQRGFVSLEHGGVELPNPDYKLIKPDSTANKIYSEVYM
ncbi:hypothetical protein SAMN06265379_10416 [Saccharicrinis carchari]|uniref:Uncharacterized protein n=1 Tax=Saccharicrinis carchari TaxID=1168039 RepID=A0A521CX98_SACCC|nr:hypothetical protein [Saccharicrinis carchari]SMO64073.1 hypothetical protein SAMN06265379_10416 [Saccharicrinis carchari]